MEKYKVALTIAGSDSSGGAGIQADLKTFSALGCYGMSVITALTAQNTQGVQAISAVPPKFVQQQLDSCFSDIKINAIKTGMLFSASIIEVVAEYITNHRIPLIVDPVMVSKNGSLLLKKNAINSLSEKLLPLTTLLTPNIDEAEYLLKKSIINRQTMQRATRELCDMGPKAVLLKGGHLHAKTSDDCLYIRKDKKFYWFEAQRVVTNNTHGTGCTLSSAITAFLAQGNKLTDSVSYAKEYITKALVAGSKYKLGSGHGSVHHFHEIWS
jgi:hydroxymethylpyrimidine/phosphomethylpyrimidine kinase